MRWGFLLALVLVLFLVGCGGCQKEGKSVPPKVEEPVFPGAEGAGVMPGNACFDAGFFPCPEDQCENETKDLPAGSNNVCCAKSCTGAQEIQATEGDASATCAAQGANDCGETNTCPEQQWMKSSDVIRCCKTACIERIQTTTKIDGLGEVVIERFGPGKFGVFYGQGAKIGGIDIGRSAYATATNVGKNEYEFTTTDGRKFRFKITKETDSEISAEGVKKEPQRDERGCRVYFERKGLADPKQPVIVPLPVPDECLGSQCLLRLKISGGPVKPETPNTVQQIMFTQIDDQISLEGEPVAAPFAQLQRIPSAPKSGVNGDDKALTILSGPWQCSLSDDYPPYEKGKDKIVFTPHLNAESTCTLEVCSGAGTAK
ncbi:hypothetical protein HY639_03890 [Candidatus Woesearchaeota archaeon]|nr:hypothetical protein [Candidatus Woesearchaeota archaeon]